MVFDNPYLGKQFLGKSIQGNAWEPTENIGFVNTVAVNYKTDTNQFSRPKVFLPLIKWIGYTAAYPTFYHICFCLIYFSYFVCKEEPNFRAKNYFGIKEKLVQHLKLYIYTIMRICSRGHEIF